MPLRNVLFDLDGTLTDPADGITRCYAHALERLGRTSPSRSELLRFIGPPMRENFAATLGGGDRELIERAVLLYRERFARVASTRTRSIPACARCSRRCERRAFASTSPRRR